MMSTSTTMVLLAFVALSLLITNGSAANAESVSETKPVERWACAVVHVNLSCPHAFRAHVFLWEQRTSNPWIVAADRWLESAPDARWAAETMRGCAHVNRHLPADHETTFSMTVEEQNCDTKWKSSWWTVDEHLSDESVGEYVLRSELVAGAIAHIERLQFSKDNKTAMEVLIPDVPRPPNTVELIEANAPRYCIKTHLLLKCSHAFKASVQILKARPELTGYVVVEKEVSGKKAEDSVFVAAGVLEACIPLDDANFSSRASAFYINVPEQTCLPENWLETFYKGLETPIRWAPLVNEYEIRINVDDFMSVRYIKPHFDNDKTNVPTQRDPPPLNTTELIKTGALRYCIKLHIQLNCTHPFDATVRIWKSLDKFIGYWAAEGRLGTTSDAGNGIFVATAPLEVCVPMADANYLFTPFFGGYIRNEESSFYISIPEQTCYSDDDSSYFQTKFLLPYQIGTTAYDFRLQLGQGLEEPVIGPHVSMPSKAEDQVEKLLATMRKQNDDFVSLMKKHHENVMGKLEENSAKTKKSEVN